MHKSSPATQTGQYGVQAIHNRVPGRARFRVYGLKADPELKTRLEKELSRQTGIYEACASFQTGKILVRFDQRTAPESIENRIRRLLDLDPVKEQPSSIPQGAAANRDNPSSGKHAQGQILADTGDWHRQSASRTLEMLEVEKAAGLSTTEAEARLGSFGRNMLPQRPGRSGMAMFAEQFKSLPVGLLAAAAGLSVGIGAFMDAAVIMGVLTVNSVIGYATERSSERTIQALQKVEPPPVPVVRDQKSVKVAAEDVVPGDILVLKPGTYVAADARIVEGEALTIDESSLTGESMPVEKFAKALKKKGLPLSELRNMAFTGSVVTGGWGKAVAVATGTNTAFGQYQRLLQDTLPPRPPIEMKLDRTGNQLVKLWGGVCAGVFGMGLLRGFEMLNILRVSVSLAAAAVPEGLPASATTTFALGINEMKKYGILVRHMPAVETLGSVQTICLDKTGTITHNRMTVVEVYTGDQRIRAENGVLALDEQPAAGAVPPELDQLLTVGALCSQVKINGNSSCGDPELVGSPTENALVHTALGHGMDVKAIRRQHKLIEVNHRSEKHPVMSTIHTAPEDKILHAVKGSPLDVLDMCSYYMKNGEVVELTVEARNAVREENKRMASNAYRVLGAAVRKLDSINQARKPNGFVWVGLIAMRDPIRPHVKAAIQAFHKAGIQTVMITGDQPLTAEAVARELNLSNVEPFRLMDASEMTDFSPEELKDRAPGVHAYSRVSPAHKLKIVQAIQAGGKVVAMTGDGINDAPALKAADVGIALGEDGTDVARDVADVVLEKDNLDTIIQSVRHGRTTYGNIKKSVHFFLSTNFTETMLMAGAMGAGIGAPLTAMQLLWINIISDIFPGLALSLEPPEADVLEQSPRSTQEPIFSKSDYGRMIRESSVMTGTAMGAYGYGLLRYGMNGTASAIAFHSLTLGQLLHAFSCRTDSRTVFGPENGAKNNWLNLAVYGSIGLHLGTMFIPALRGFLGLAPLSAVDTAVVFGSSLLSFLGNETIKGLKPQMPSAQAARERLHRMQLPEAGNETAAL